MSYSSLLLKFEIILFCIFLLYVIYFICEKGFYFLLQIKDIVGKRKKHKKLDLVTPPTLEEKNIKPTTYGSNKSLSITDDERNRILELLKKIKINIAKFEYDLAKNLIVEGLTIDKFHIELNMELASIYILEKDYIKSEYIYKDLLLVHNDDFDILKKLAYVLTMQEKYDLAIEMYKKCYDLKSDDFEIINMLAHLYYHKELYIDSISYLKMFLKENPRDSDNMILLAASYRNIGKINDSIHTYEKVLDTQPYNEEVKKEIAELQALEYGEKEE